MAAVHTGGSGMIPCQVPRDDGAPAGTVAFVLQGGGSLCAAQVGALRALTQAGITPDLVVGSSAGALNGAAFAADPSIEGLDRPPSTGRSSGCPRPPPRSSASSTSGTHRA
ncbi:patatin-like phospholipase family protein [Streptomyces sp. NPDC088732]|uniref:patatin-like phospholipase family protein n=1 Tax=Streptomyces sp. NPDC088732 TaxID=3365879 RepID=UPI003821AC12